LEEKEKPQAEKPVEARPLPDDVFVPPLFSGESEPDMSINEEPLQPLTPADTLVDAIGDMYAPQEPVYTDMDDFYGSAIEEHVPRVFRPRAPVASASAGNVCPKGYAGMCLICSEAPCDYWKARVLRQILTEIQYGKE